MTGRRTPWAIRAHDLALAGVAMTGTLLVRYYFEGRPAPTDMVVRATFAYVSLCAVVFHLFRLHAGVWRFTALNDVRRVLLAAASANILLLPILFSIDRLEDFPRSTPFLATAATTLLLCLGRLGAHAVARRDWRAGLRFENRDLPAALVVGSMKDVAAFLARGSAQQQGLRPAGIITLDETATGRTVKGVEVLGDLSRLEHTARALAARDDRPPQIVLADSRPSRAILDQVVAAAAMSGSQVARARASGGASSMLSPVQAADLLARPPRSLDPARARSLIEGKRVLVTGAGGTIGSELTRQAAALDPAGLILLDASEFNLYGIDHELRERECGVRWTAELGDIRDVNRLEEVFRREKPDVVLHAAALKHVPLMEMNPAEAVLTNVAGALNAARLARDACEAFVYISTDKAVNPTNVMGATKRVGEKAVQALATGGSARVALVRFGNVLGSAGSVVPLFERQIAQGGPLTITHKDMVRYFMTVQEAATLVLAAGALPDAPGEAHVYVLDMGEPVRIDDLARQLIRLHGLTPEKDIDIRYTGLRPGEKLSEEIFYPAETVKPTSVDGVLVAAEEPPGWTEQLVRLGELIEAATERDQPRVIAALRSLEPAFKPG